MVLAGAGIDQAGEGLHLPVPPDEALGVPAPPAGPHRSRGHAGGEVLVIEGDRLEDARGNRGPGLDRLEERGQVAAPGRVHDRLVGPLQGLEAGGERAGISHAGTPSVLFTMSVIMAERVIKHGDLDGPQRRAMHILLDGDGRP